MSSILLFFIRFLFLWECHFYSFSGLCQGYCRKRNLVLCCIDYCNFNLFTAFKWSCCLGSAGIDDFSAILLSQCIRGPSSWPSGFDAHPTTPTVPFQLKTFAACNKPPLRSFIVSCLQPHCHFPIKEKKNFLSKQKHFC